MENKTKIKKQTPFWNLYKGEVKKSISIPFLIGIIVVYLILLLVTHTMFNSLVRVMDVVEEASSDTEGMPEGLYMPEGFMEPENFDAAYDIALYKALQSDGTYIFKSEADIDLALNFSNSEKSY